MASAPGEQLALAGALGARAGQQPGEGAGPALRDGDRLAAEERAELERVDHRLSLEMVVGDDDDLPRPLRQAPRPLRPWLQLVDRVAVIVALVAAGVLA